MNRACTSGATQPRFDQQCCSKYLYLTNLIWIRDGQRQARFFKALEVVERHDRPKRELID